MTLKRSQLFKIKLTANSYSLFQFNKRSHFFVGPYNESFSIEMLVSNQCPRALFSFPRVAEAIFAIAPLGRSVFTRNILTDL